MLADLTLVNCYNTSTLSTAERDKIILQSAKTNLQRMAFFGIMENMTQSQIMFEVLFNMRFTKNMDVWTRDKSSDTVYTEEQRDRMMKRNHLDLQLYEFAVNLFSTRVDQMGIRGRRRDIVDEIIYGQDEDDDDYQETN